MAESITVGGLRFLSSGYTLTGDVLTLGVSSNTIEVGSSMVGTISSTLAGNNGFRLTGGGTLVLSGTNSNSGAVIIESGMLQLAGNARLIGALTLSASSGATARLDINDLATAVGALTFGGAAGTTSQIITAGSAGGLTLGGNITYDAAHNPGGSTITTATLHLGGADRTFNIGQSTGISSGDAELTVNAVIQGANALLKTGAGTLRLNAPNAYTGITSIRQGTLVLGRNQALPTGAVQLGSNVSATLDLQSFNQTITSLSGWATGGSLATTQTSYLRIESGGTLTVTGPMFFGSNVSGTTYSRLTATGGGNLVYAPTGGGALSVGNSPTGFNAYFLDLSGLHSFTANLGSQTLRIGDDSSESVVTEIIPGTSLRAGSSLRLAANNTLTGAKLSIGEVSGAQVSYSELVLGSGANVLRFNTVALSAGGGRSDGTLKFDAADVTGTVRITSVGNGKAAIILVSTNATSGANYRAVLDLRGHQAEVLASTVTMATRTGASGGGATAYLGFDKGTLSIDTLLMARRDGTGLSGAVTATVDLGNSVDSSTTTIGSLTMAQRANGNVTNVSNAYLNIYGGNVVIGAGSGTAITMGDAVSTLISNAVISLSGGTLTLQGNVVLNGTSPNRTAVIRLDGGTFDVNNRTIGSAGTGAITLTVASGQMLNLGELNGGGTLVKTGALTLTMGGTNNYTGATSVSQGTLIINGMNTGNGLLTVDGTLQIGAGGATGSIAGTSIINNGSLVFNRSGVLTYTGVITGAGTLAVVGSGAITLTAEHTYTGVTTVSDGQLTIADGGGITSSVSVNGTGTFVADGNIRGLVTVADGGTLKGSGDVGAIHVQNGGTLAPGNSVDTLEITGDGVTVGGDLLTITGGSRIVFEFLDAAGNPGATGWDYIDLAAGGTLNLSNVDSSGKIRLDIVSFLPDNSGLGESANFVPAADYSWLFIQADNLAGVSETELNTNYLSYFDINSDGVFADGGGPFPRPLDQFGNPAEFAIQWQVGGTNGTGLYITFTAVPEPGSLLMAGLGSLATAWFGKRRRKSNAVTASATDDGMSCPCGLADLGNQKS